MRIQSVQTLVLCALLVSMAAPAMADKPAWAGKGGKHQEEREDHDEHPGKRGGKENAQPEFDSRDRETIRLYYTREIKQGKNCPPGLAKKNNGCMPPGQAKKWAMGQPLPKDVEIHEMPSDLVRLLGGVSPDYRYVRVASDILKIAVGTRMVVGAIQDLGQSR